jgi:hypothetical protein
MPLTLLPPENPWIIVRIFPQPPQILYNRINAALVLKSTFPELREQDIAWH